MPLIYLITVNYHSAALIARLAESIRVAQSHVETAILVVVNNSPDDTDLPKGRQDAMQILEAGENLGFGAACNLGLQWVFERDRAAIVWLINPDAYLTPTSLQQVKSFFAAHPACAIVGTVVETLTGAIWFGGGRFDAKTGTISTELQVPTDPTREYVPCDWVTGCSMLIQLKNFEQCPQFDPAYFLYYEDFDFCRRYLRQGHSVGIATQIRVRHQPSSVTDRDRQAKLKYSTASYLLTLERYTSRLTRLWRLLRLAIVAVGRLPTQPDVAIGKLQGLVLYWNRVSRRGQSAPD